MEPSSLAVIAGPTAVGKTQIALALARLIPVEIVCADSRTLYRGMDIGTAKPSRADREAVPHHVLDVADLDHVVTLAEYQRLALRAVGEIRRRGRVPLLVGGTGLYIRAVVDGLAIPGAAPDWRLRAELEVEERTIGPGTLHRRLAHVDPASASRIHPRNIRRIIRALEVHARTGVPISVLQAGSRDSAASAVMVALTLDRTLLYDRIDRRIDAQIAAGLIEEVRALLRGGYPRTLPALQAIGYKEIAAHLNGVLSREEAVSLVRRNTRHYAKRQLIWLRADHRYQWMDVGDDPPAVVAARIHAMMAV